tara:strand:+ start:57056 stop:57184 length:129 start_codon:yes stop_codon:yes gene_type:complete
MHWLAANKEMIFSELLIGLGKLPPRGVFSNLHPENNHGLEEQ